MQMEQRLSSVYKVKLGLLYPLAPIEGLPTVKLLKFITEICLWRSHGKDTIDIDIDFITLPLHDNPFD